MQLRGIALPKVQMVRRISSATFSLKALAERGVQYTRQIASNGDIWEIQGFVDKVTLDQLLGLSQNGTVWVMDPDRGNFHAALEVEASWVADDAPELERTS